MLRFSRRQKTMIGLSVLPESIYLVQLKHVRNNFEMLYASETAMPDNWERSGPKNAFSQVQTLLTTLVRDHGLAMSQAAICVPLSLVKMHSLVVPAGLAVREVEAEVYAEAARMLPLKNEKIAFDYQAQTYAVKEEKSIFFVATGESYLSQYAVCLREAGLKPAVIEIDIFAMLRAARYVLKNTGFDTEKIAVLYVTAEYGLIAAHDGKELLFYKHWDAQSQTRHQISLMQWVEWCCQAYRQAGINILGLSGAEAVMTSATHVIHQHWSCELVILDPFTSLPLPASSAISNRFGGLIACGLAMREPLSWLN